MKYRAAANPIEWTGVLRPRPDEDVCGDLFCVHRHDTGALLAVIDGIGHGPEARRLSEIAASVLQQYPDEPVIYLMKRCHESLRQTRGIVMTLASFCTRLGTLTWCGVGNVDAWLVREFSSTKPNERALLRGGTIGAQLPDLYAGIVTVNPGDILIMTTDGIRPEFERDIPTKAPLQRIADHILDKYWKGVDDSCVLVTRFLGDLGHE